MNEREHRVVNAIKAALRFKVEGQCYPAAEAAYHLLGGKKAGYMPVRGGGHWWIVNGDGEIIDPTAAQYPDGFDYSVGKGGGFLTKLPSKRAMKLLGIIHFATQGSLTKWLRTNR